MIISQYFYHSTAFELLFGWSPPHFSLFLSPVLPILQHLEFFWTGINEWINGLILYDFAIDVIEPSAGLHSPTNSNFTQHVFLFTDCCETCSWNLHQFGKIIFGQYKIFRSIIGLFLVVRLSTEGWYFLECFKFRFVEVEDVGEEGLLQDFIGCIFILLRIKYLQNINEILAMFVHLVLPQPVMVECTGLITLQRIVRLGWHQVPHFLKQTFVLDNI